jgi:hypothetical protein
VRRRSYRNVRTREPNAALIVDASKKEEPMMDYPTMWFDGQARSVVCKEKTTSRFASEHGGKCKACVNLKYAKKVGDDALKKSKRRISTQ